MKTIRSRFVGLVATVAVAPLLLYGLVSVGSLRAGTRQSVLAGNRMVTGAAAAQIAQYFTNSVRVLRAASADLNYTDLAVWQQTQVLRNYVLDFPEYREITIYDADGTVLATSRLGRPRVRLSPEAVPLDLHIAPIEIDEALLPKTIVTIPLQARGLRRWLVGELNLEEMWRLVDRIRVGQRGFALLVDPDGLLIAHGDPDEKERVAQGERLAGHPLLAAPPAAADPWSLEYETEAGQRVLGIAARVDPPGWTLVLEQPTDEAYALASRLVGQLAIAIGLALLLTVAVGAAWGRSFLEPITALTRGTRALAEGRLDERVRITRGDEFQRLGDAFNTMADRLVELQQETVRQERQAMFGRVAAGLAHDLAHPIQNIGNNCKLILKMHDDPEYRESFRRTIERETATVRRMLEDLRHLARPMPLERFPIDVNRSVTDVVERLRSQITAAGVSMELDLDDAKPHVEGDLFALSRVYRNLIVNALQATLPGGRLAIRTRQGGARVLIEVADSGAGIPPERLPSIFDDFSTTKRRGLGLGLAISRKIVEQLGGAIRAASTVGQGTTVTIELPAVEAPGDPAPVDPDRLTKAVEPT